MKHVFLLFILLRVFSASAQEWQLDSIFYDTQWYYRYPVDKKPGIHESTELWKQNDGSNSRLPKDGSWIQFYTDQQQPAQIWGIRNGKKSGLFTRFHPDGRPAETGFYTDELQDGSWKRWYANGQLQSEQCYDNGKHDDTYKTWYENGILKRESVAGVGFTDYDENGNRKYDHQETRHGFIDRYWYENGQLRVCYELVGGHQKDTVQTYYYPNGQVSESGSIYRDQRYGVWKSWYEDGTMRSEGGYGHVETSTTGQYSTKVMLDYKAGKWQYFYVSGKLLAEGSYRNEPKLSQRAIFTHHRADPVKNNDWLYYDEAGNYVSYDAVKDLLEAIEQQVN